MRTWDKLCKSSRFLFDISFTYAQAQQNLFFINPDCLDYIFSGRKKASYSCRASTLNEKPVVILIKKKMLANIYCV